MSSIKPVNPVASLRERRVIVEIAERAAVLAHQADRFYIGKIVVAISVCHANGCPLDLDGLLAAPAQDFAHDVFEIVEKIDTHTGTLRDCFLPRYAKPEEKTNEKEIG